MTTLEQVGDGGQNSGGNEFDRRVARHVHAGHRPEPGAAFEPGSVVDEWMVPQDESITYAKGKQNDVDVLVGSNHDEGTFFGGGNVTAEAAKSNAQKTYGDLANEFLQLYPAGSDAEAAASGLARTRDEVGWHEACDLKRNCVVTGSEAQGAYGVNTSFTCLPDSARAARRIRPSFLICSAILRRMDRGLKSRTRSVSQAS